MSNSREWAERIADQFSVTDSPGMPGVIDAIEEGISRGLQLAEDAALKRYAKWREESRGWANEDATVHQRHAFVKAEEASETASAIRASRLSNLIGEGGNG